MAATSPAAPCVALSGSGRLRSTIANLEAALNNASIPLSQRYRALFGLKHLACSSSASAIAVAATVAIASGLTSRSALLKHEVAYCLGQSGSAIAIPYLEATLRDQSEDSMVRHESAEALGAIGHTRSIGLLKEKRDNISETAVVRETCEIAVARIEWQESEQSGHEKLQKRSVRDSPFHVGLGTLIKCGSNFASVDPAPPLPEVEQTLDVPALRSITSNNSLPLFRRYRAMFALRDLASPPALPTAIPAVEALATSLRDMNSSALFRHEVAFVFGQLSHPASIPALVASLRDGDEVPMVRHEAAEALGALGDNPVAWESLKEHLKDKEQVVRESIEVALDMAEFERSGGLEYAKLGVGEVDALAPLLTSEA